MDRMIATVRSLLFGERGDPRLRFLAAARIGNTEMVRTMLANGVNIHTGDDLALRWAAACGNTDTVRCLLEAGADVHAQDDEALDRAVEEGQDDVAEVLREWIARDEARLQALVMLAQERGPPWIGDRVEDGTIFVGISPDSNKPFYAAAADAPLVMTWKQTAKYAAASEEGGHHDWRVPSKTELEVLYRHREAGSLKDSFNNSGSDFAGWYWSSTEYPGGDSDPAALMKDFSHGFKEWACTTKGMCASVRLVRG